MRLKIQLTHRNRSTKGEQSQYESLYNILAINSELLIIGMQ